MSKDLQFSPFTGNVFVRERGIPLANAGGLPPVQKSGVPAFWFSRALETGGPDNLNTPYRDSAWVRRAIKHVSGPISSVELVFSKPKQDAALRRHRGHGRRLFTTRGIVRRDESAEIELPRVREFLRAPMPGLTYEDFVEASIGWMKLTECFWLLDDRASVPFPEQDARPFPPLIVARPDRMRHVVEGGNIVGWQYRTAQGMSYTLDPKQVVRLFGWNPYDDFRGLGDYPSAHIATETNWLSGKFRRNLMGNNGDTGPYIVAKNGIPTDPQREQILMDLRAKRQAQLRGDFRPIFLTGDISIEDPQIKSVDAAFIAGQMEDRHEIYVAMGVPPGLADVKASYSIGQASDWFALVFNTCIPEGKKFCAALEILIERLTGEKIEVGLDWDEHYVMQQVRSERMKDMDVLWGKGAPVKSIGEYLGLNLPRFEGDDIGYLPFSVAPVGSAGLDEPAPDVTTSEDYSESGETKPAKSLPAPVGRMLSLLQKNSVHPVNPVSKSGSNKARWEAHMRTRLKSVRMFQSKASKVFNDFRATALKHFYATRSESALRTPRSELVTKSLLDLIFDEKSFGRTLIAQLDPISRAVLQTAGTELFSEIGKADDPWQMPPQAATEYLGSRAGGLQGVAATARGQLNTVLQQALNDGLSTEETANKIREVFNNLGKGEARRIAMTETSAAYGFSRHQAMSDAGVQFKSWLSSHGPNVRPAHQRAEQEYGSNPIPVDDPFIVDGEELMYPGDDSGSPGNVINCQCVQIAVANPNPEEDV